MGLRSLLWCMLREFPPFRPAQGRLFLAECARNNGVPRNLPTQVKNPALFAHANKDGAPARI
jgi:hypothetical protein